MELRPGKPALAPAVAVPTVAAAGKRGMRLQPYNTRHGLLRQPDPLPQAQAPVRGERLSHALPPVLLAARPRGLYAKFVRAAAYAFRGGAQTVEKSKRGAKPFRASIVPGGVYGGDGAIFAAENPIFQSKNRFFAVSAPGNP